MSQYPYRDAEAVFLAIDDLIKCRAKGIPIEPVLLAAVKERFLKALAPALDDARIVAVLKEWTKRQAERDAT